MGSQRLRRRRLIQGGLVLAGLGLVAGCQGWPTWGDPPARIPRVGILRSRDVDDDVFQAFRDGLAELGYIDGTSIVIDERRADTSSDFPALAAELVTWPVDVLVVIGLSGPAAMAATKTIPIVFLSAGNPISQGFVSNLARPGGNVTGLSNQQAQVQGKHLQYLVELVPGTTRVLYLTETTIGKASGGLALAQQTAPSLGINLLTPDIFNDADLQAAFELGVANRAEAVLVTATPLMTRSLTAIITRAATHRVPVIGQDREFAVAGALSSYAPNRVAQYRRGAVYVDKILKGTPPGDLPVEQPTVFDFIINQRTAHELGLTIPPSVLAQATEIIR